MEILIREGTRSLYQAPSQVWVLDRCTRAHGAFQAPQPSHSERGMWAAGSPAEPDGTGFPSRPITLPPDLTCTWSTWPNGGAFGLPGSIPDINFPKGSSDWPTGASWSLALHWSSTVRRPRDAFQTYGRGCGIADSRLFDKSVGTYVYDQEAFGHGDDFKILTQFPGHQAPTDHGLPKGQEAVNPKDRLEG
jgi:hypothetical protein